MMNRRFVRRLDPTLRKTENPRTGMREPFKKPPPAQRKHVREAMPDQHDAVPVEGLSVQDDGHQGVGGLCDRHDVTNLDQGGRDADDGANAPVRDDVGAAAAQVVVERVPDVINDDAQGGGQTRPRRSPKPNSKYNPEVFDLSYVGVRKRSRKSIRRAGR